MRWRLSEVRWQLGNKRLLELYLSGGPNGAGKTTLALKLLPALGCRHFVNADSIASGLEPLAGEDVALRAGVLMMKRVRELMDDGIDFTSESTLAARAWVPLIRSCQTRSYTFNLIYVGCRARTWL
ncbi:MAG: hypothetical protein JWN98_2023 [Abditibacteriota bacterium]|nr:hypothetical protein [Abditibacteriota bacterium]